MAVTAVYGSPTRHPWLDLFVQAPVEMFGDLLAGYARIPPYERADAPDAARMLFGGLPKTDRAWRALGPAILGWLEQRRRATPPTGRPRQQRWVREICEAFEIVALLDVADAAATLRGQFVTWNEWAARFVLSPARDARAEYLRMVALTQPLVAALARQRDPNDLAPMWLEICRQAGAELPRRYLAIGLLGLRRLQQGTTGSDAPWVAGLAHWALARSPTNAEFQAEWLALKPLYPRTDGRWRELVGPLLATKLFKDADIKAPAWWRGDRDFDPMLRQDFRVPGAPLHSPFPAECDHEIERLHNPWPVTESRIDQFLQHHRRYVGITGESQYFVRALHALGTALIRPGNDQPQDRARKAAVLAREGLGWEPNNRYLWSLWRDAMAASGALEAAELIGWEFVRRDPDDADSRNQLATLLAGPLARPADAETLLRETIAAFPGDAVARTQLAELLIADLPIVGRRLDDAEAVVQSAFAAQAVGEATFALRARLQSHRGETKAALETVRQGLERLPSSAVLRDYQRILDQGRVLRLDPAAAAPIAATVADTTPDDPTLAPVLRLGRFRRVRAQADSADPATRQAAVAEVQAILADDPSFAYAQLLAIRQGLVTFDPDTMPPFAVAFEQALKDKDRPRLEALAERQPRLEALILLAQALFGDAQAAWTVANLLHDDPPANEARPVAFLRARLHPLLAQATADTALSIVEANDNAIRRWLRDANESLIAA
jgi:tetratricopeptide (TPR) repeat protein